MTVAASPSTPPAPSPAPAPLRTPDFTAVAYRLRGLLVEAMHEPLGDAADIACLTIRNAVVRVEHELAVQAALYLADHLIHFEDFRRAALLFAYALPDRLLADDRVRQSLQWVVDVAERQATPEAEILAARTKVQSSPDNFASAAYLVAPRALYFLSCCRIARARTAVEYGTGSGANLFHLAQLEPAIQWVGLDASEQQIEENRRVLAAIPEGARVRRYGITFAALPAAPKRWQADAVGVLDVVEHTLHPEVLLGAAEQFCRPGGLMIVTVPDGPWSLHTPNVLDVAALPGQHVAGYTLPELIGLVGRRGRVLDARSLPGPAAREGNRSACVCYEPTRPA